MSKNKDYLILWMITYLIVFAVIIVTIIIQDAYEYTLMLYTLTNGLAPTTITFAGAILAKHITRSEDIKLKQSEYGIYLLICMIVYTILYIAYIAVCDKELALYEYVFGIFLFCFTQVICYIAKQAYCGTEVPKQLVSQGKISG